jgi:hypothetical protein
VTIDLRAAHSYEKVTFGHTTRIDMHIGYVALRIADDILYADILYNV